MPYRYGVLGILAAIPTWAAVLLLTAFYSLDAVERVLFNTPFSSHLPFNWPTPWGEQDVFTAIGIYAALLLLLALPFAILFAVLECWRGQPPHHGDNVRSTLSVWPGLPLAAAGLVAVAILWIVQGLPMAAFAQKLVSGVGGHILTGMVLAFATAAAVTGGRPAKAAAVVAAPTVLVLFAGLVYNQAVSVIYTAIFAQLAILGVAFVIAGFVSRNHGLFWWGAGLFAPLLMMAPILAGVLTPTETIAILALVAIPVGLIVNTAVRRTGMMRPMLVGAIEIAALCAIVGFVNVAGYLAAFAQVQPNLEPLLATPPLLQLLLLALLLILIGTLITPLLAIAIVVFMVALPAALGKIGFDFAAASALLVLAGIVAMLLRSIRGRSEPPPFGASSITMSLPVALSMTGVAITLMILTAVAILYLSLLPTR